eukprot:2731125-Pyramimonas_sp.AAC.2
MNTAWGGLAGGSRERRRCDGVAVRGVGRYEHCMRHRGGPRQAVRPPHVQTLAGEGPQQR